MTTPTPLEAAAQFLFAGRIRGTPGPRIPVECRPADVHEAVAIQRRVAELVGQPVGGWKVALPTAARALSYGAIFAPTIVTGLPYPVIGTGATAKVEPEIAYVLGRDLPARGTPYSEEEVGDAVREARLVLEIIGPRFEDPASVTFPELLADSVANQGLYVVPVVPDAMHRSLEAFPITISGATGVLATKDGKHPDVHPLRPLHWLANHLAAQGMPLRAGQIVTTGSYCGIVVVPLGELLTFACGDIGELIVTLTRAV